jgi:hypothetical protein
MTKLDWNWSEELETCHVRMSALETVILSQQQKIQRLLDRGKDAEFTKLVLVRMEQSLERVRSHKNMIESRVTERAAGQNGAAQYETADPPG